MKIVRHVNFDELKTMIRKVGSRKDLTDAKRKHVEHCLRYKGRSVA